jgi:DNA-binding MarR family transcriptional regulator
MASPADDGADLGILLTLALRGFVDQLHAELRVHGFEDVRPAFGVVFRALQGDPLTLTALSSRLGVTKQSAAKVVDEMEAKKLLRRRDSRTDGRAKLIELTARGRKAMKTAIEVGAQINQRLRDAVGPEAAATMHRSLASFVDQAGLGEDLARRSSPAVWDGA